MLLMIDNYDSFTFNLAQYLGELGVPPIVRRNDQVSLDDIAAMAEAWRRASTEGTEFRCDCRMRRRDGVWRVFDNHALPQRNADGEESGSTYPTQVTVPRNGSIVVVIRR